MALNRKEEELKRLEEEYKKRREKLLQEKEEEIEEDSKNKVNNTNTPPLDAWSGMKELFKKKKGEGKEKRKLPEGGKQTYYKDENTIVIMKNYRGTVVAQFWQRFSVSLLFLFAFGLGSMIPLEDIDYVFVGPIIVLTIFVLYFTIFHIENRYGYKTSVFEINTKTKEAKFEDYLGQVYIQELAAISVDYNPICPSLSGVLVSGRNGSFYFKHVENPELVREFADQFLKYKPIQHMVIVKDNRD